MNDDDGTEPPCDGCYVELDEDNVEIWDIYSLVRGQLRLAPMGEVIGLDYKAVLDIVKLYFAADEVREIFESIIKCFQIEQELASK